MTSQTPNPNNPFVRAPGRTSTPTARVKWDNVLIAAVGAVAAVVAVVLVFLGADTPAQTPPPPVTPIEQDTIDAPPAIADVSMTLDDANSLVEEARALMTEARWDEAQDRLSTVPDELRTSSGATQLATTLAETRTRWTTLVAKVDGQVARSEWKPARATLDELAKIATFRADLTATATLVDEQLAKLTQERVVTPPAAAAAAAPAANTTTTPTPRPRPAAPATRPAAGTGARPTTPGTQQPTATGGLGGLHQQDLATIEDAVNDALEDL